MATRRRNTTQEDPVLHDVGCRNPVSKEQHELRSFDRRLAIRKLRRRKLGPQPVTPLEHKMVLLAATVSTRHGLPSGKHQSESIWIERLMQVIFSCQL